MPSSMKVVTFSPIHDEQSLEDALMRLSPHGGIEFVILINFISSTNQDAPISVGKLKEFSLCKLLLEDANNYRVEVACSKAIKEMSTQNTFLLCKI
jgi:hypothetical protein